MKQRNDEYLSAKPAVPTHDLSKPLLPANGALSTPGGDDTLTARSMRNENPTPIDPADKQPLYTYGPATSGTDLSRGTEMPPGITSMVPISAQRRPASDAASPTWPVTKSSYTYYGKGPR